ncbi:cardiolipin synthase [Bacteroides sp. OttesenSCG-928-D19]|nr:cardiolipin synthase [Bacteroides sp. OttesenSCG-928-N06]MDL2305439.1 cardiolipin synthase [Bacteroides sp. OttesenSCG-928-D19]
MKYSFSKYILSLLLCLVAGYSIAQEATGDSLVLRYLAESKVPISYNNKVKLLPSGEAKFNDMFEHLKNARHHIHMEYFNFRNDSIAALMFTILSQKAKEGVEIRLLFDAFGNASNNQPLKNRHLKAIRSTGIEIEKFDPLKFPYLNHIFHRDHRKIVVIDGQTAYTGGMNVADYYINGLPDIGPWRDMHLRIEGNAVHDLQDIFLTIWNKKTKQKIAGDAYYPPIEEQDTKTVAIVDRAPRVSPKQLRRTFVKAINSSEEIIQIVNPYFVPTRSIKKAIKNALKRGVEVEIMISSKADINFTPDASFYVSHQLMKKGAEVYLYNEGFHHSKIMMIDSLFCTVGSANLDSRSLRYDYETNAFIFDKETTHELMNLFEADKQNSTIMTKEYWKKRSTWKKFVGWFAHLFTPIL